MNGAAATITNSGTIDSLSFNGVYLAAGGILTNQAGAVIDGGVHGVYLTNPSGTVTNHGMIEGGSAGFATLGPGHETLINFGTIASTAGAAGVAVEIDGSVGGNVLIVEPHAVFVGAVLGGGESEIEFVGAVADMSGVDGFATIVLANGVAHSLTLTAANFVDVTDGVITIFDGNKGNTVSAAGVANAIIVHAGTGKDVLTGGAGNDVFYAGGRTTMTGGAGANEFVFAHAGHNTITDFAFSPTNELVFSNKGFDLGLPNATSTRAVLPSRLVAVNSTGSFTNTHQRFAYDTKDGDLVLFRYRHHRPRTARRRPDRRAAADHDAQPPPLLHHLRDPRRPPLPPAPSGVRPIAGRGALGYQGLSLRSINQRQSGA